MPFSCAGMNNIFIDQIINKNVELELHCTWLNVENYIIVCYINVPTESIKQEAVIPNALPVLNAIRLLCISNANSPERKHIANHIVYLKFDTTI